MITRIIQGCWAEHPNHRAINRLIFCYRIHKSELLVIFKIFVYSRKNTYQTLNPHHCSKSELLIINRTWDPRVVGCTLFPIQTMFVKKSSTHEGLKVKKSPSHNIKTKKWFQESNKALRLVIGQSWGDAF